MAEPLNILIVEDSTDDAALLLDELRDAGFDPSWKRVETAPDYQAALKDKLDLIFSDFSLPQFSVQRGLELLRQNNLEIPFIIVSGTIGEERAVESLKAGATDYVLKDRRGRLGPAVRRALRESQERTERKRAEEQLQLANAQMLHMLEHNPTILYALGIESGRLVPIAISANIQRLLGIAPERADQDWWLASLHPEDRDRVLAADASAACRSGRMAVYRLRHQDGSYRWIEDSNRVVRDAAGNISELVGAWTDITDRQQTEAALHESRRQFQEMLESVALIAVTVDTRGVVTFCNDYLLNLTGWKKDDVIGKDWFAAFIPDSGMDVRGVFFEAVDRGEISTHYENQIKTRTGELRDIVWTNTILKGGAGKVIGTAGIGEDVTERKRAEKRMMDALNFNRTMLEASPLGILTYTERGELVSTNTAAARLVGGTIDQLKAQNFRQIESWKKCGLLAAADRALSTRSEVELEVNFITTFKKDVSLAFRFVPFQYEDQLHLMALFSDIAERKRAAQALSESEQRLRQLAENIHEVFWMTDPAKHVMLYISPAYERIWGRPVERLYQNPQEWAESIYPEDRQRVVEAALLKQVTGEYDEVYRIQRLDGSIRWIRDRAFPIRDQSGRVYRLVGTAQDITDQRHLEAQLRQAQKLEAIGTLAGGIAHDFNNILGAVLGYLELAKFEAENKPELLEYLNAVGTAGGRARDLVRQILTFSRQQEQQRIPVQLRHVVGEALRLLRAGTPSTIRFETSLAKDTPTVLADTTQIHQIVMNLGTNAAHAMRAQPGVLEITLERLVLTSELAIAGSCLPPGLYAHLSIKDTGHGMKPDTLQRIFEPFFTTKGPGEGTGLGLSVVHGIMQTYGGAIDVSSELGKGTVFNLYFPAVPEAELIVESQENKVPRGNGERILFVEDEEMLLQLGQKLLDRLGYVVTKSINPTIALELFKSNPAAFDLMVTDLTMPDMTGVDLARAILQVRPNFPIILTTGYSGALTHASVNALGIRDLLFKPLTYQVAAEAVHRALHKPNS